MAPYYFSDHGLYFSRSFLMYTRHNTYPKFYFTLPHHPIYHLCFMAFLSVCQLQHIWVYKQCSHTHTPACAPCMFWSSDFYKHFFSFLLSACIFFSQLDPRFLEKLHFLLGSPSSDLYLHCCARSVIQLCPTLFIILT